MKTALFACCVLLSLETPAREADATQPKRQPLDATYTIYSGEPGERQPPSAKDKKIAIAIKGKAAWGRAADPASPHAWRVPAHPTVD